VHAVKALKATIEGSVDKSVRTPAAAKFTSNKPDVDRPLSVLHTKEDLSLSQRTHQKSTKKEYLSYRENHTKDLSLSQSSTSLQQKDKKQKNKETKKALLQPYTRNKNFDTTRAHKTQPANKDLRSRATTSKLLLFLRICQKLSGSKCDQEVVKLVQWSLDKYLVINVTW
jgi:hypothetical protein